MPNKQGAKKGGAAKKAAKASAAKTAAKKASKAAGKAAAKKASAKRGATPPRVLTEGQMSDKDRKKDGERKDKKNQAMHERENEVVQEASAPQQVRDASNLTDSQPGPADTREGGNEGR